MPIRLVCPLGHPLIVDDALAGTFGECPVCQQRLVIPVADPFELPAGSLPRGEGQVRPVRAEEAVLPAMPPPLNDVRVSQIEDAAKLDLAAVAANAAPASPPPQITPPPDRRAETVIDWMPWAYGLAGVSVAAALISLWPVLGALRRPPAAPWVWLALLLSLLQLGYAFWLATLPDWSTLWIGRVVWGAMAVLDAVALATAMALPASRSLPLGLEAARSGLGPWAMFLLLLHGGIAFAVGWTCNRWRRQFERLRRSRHAK